VTYVVVLAELAGRLQFVKKIVPEPFVPTNGGSSPKCGPTLEIITSSVE